MIVENLSDFNASGNPGGPFTPVSKDYELTNDGSAPLTYIVSKSADSWFRVAPSTDSGATSTGVLLPGQSTLVTVEFTDDALLLSGQLSGAVFFQNVTNGFGDAMAAVNLSILNGLDVSVSPAEDFLSIGPAAGPWFPPSKFYNIVVNSPPNITFRVESTAPWVQVPSLRYGTIPGSSREVPVTLSVLPLSPGLHSATVRFFDHANGDTLATLTVNLTVTDPGASLPPVVMAPPDVTVEATGPELQSVDLLSNGPATALDPVDGPLTPVPDLVGPFRLGAHTVTWGVVNSFGNVGVDYQGVEVVDTRPPQFSYVPPDIETLATGYYTEVDLGVVEVLDADGVDPSLFIRNDEPSRGFQIGETIVTWSARDNSNNVAYATQKVTVLQPIKLRAMEVVQVSQNLDNSLPLIEGKITGLRAYFEPGAGPSSLYIKPVLIVRRVVDPGNEQLLGVIWPVGFGATVTASENILENRDEIGLSANFMVPGSWTQGQVKFQMVMLEQNYALFCDDVVGSLLTDCTVTVNFQPSSTIELKMVRVVHANGEGDPTLGPVSYSTLDSERQLLLTYMPTNKVLLVAVGHTDMGVRPSWRDINSSISAIRAQDICPQDCSSRLYYGVTHPDTSLPKYSGLAENVPSSVSSGTTGKWDFLIAHEVGHSLGRHHAVNSFGPHPDPDRNQNTHLGPCGSTDWRTPEGIVDPYPFPYIESVDGMDRATLSALSVESGLVFGWDSLNNTIKSPQSTFELMSYCTRDVWPSRVTYEGLLTDIQLRFGIPGAAAANFQTQQLAPARTVADTTRYTLVRGQISLLDNTATFDSFLSVDSPMALEPMPNGPYLLRLLDGSDTVIKEIAFEPSVVSGLLKEPRYKRAPSRARPVPNSGSL